MSAVVFLVAITALATPVEDEARELASELGGVAYDHRRKLAAGVPVVVYSTPDVSDARACGERISKRGHGVYACSTANVVAASEMVAVRRFDFDEDAFVSHDAMGDRLPWAEIRALVRATQRTTTETTTVVTKKQFAPVKAVATGGLVMRTTSTAKETSRATEHEPVLYVFGRPGTTPWILREQHARYDALGPAVTPHSLKNFELAVAEIRRRAPHALFDERLVARKGATPEELDVLAHVIANAVTAR
jgi:hypothetical protein